MTIQIHLAMLIPVYRNTPASPGIEAWGTLNKLLNIYLNINQ
jgi:hypothetical protein